MSVTINQRTFQLFGTRDARIGKHSLHAGCEGQAIAAEWQEPWNWQRRLGAPLRLRLQVGNDTRNVFIDRFGDVVETGESLDAKSYFAAMFGAFEICFEAEFPPNLPEARQGHSPTIMIGQVGMTRSKAVDAESVADYQAVGTFLATGLDVLLSTRSPRDPTRPKLDCMALGVFAAASIGTIICSLIETASETLASLPEAADVDPQRASARNTSNSMRA
jgi:hypothetical protein